MSGVEVKGSNNITEEERKEATIVVKNNKNN
jgi:hypothetical protein